MKCHIKSEAVIVTLSKMGKIWCEFAHASSTWCELFLCESVVRVRPDASCPGANKIYH